MSVGTLSSWLLTGDIAQAGQSIFTLTNDRHLWVTVYLEETNLAETKIGQQAMFSIDAFPGFKFHGQVFISGPIQRHNSR